MTDDMERWMRQDVVRMAAGQHGVVARWQLRAIGLGEGEVGGLVRRGRLEVVARGVYLVAGAPRSALVEVMAAVLRGGEGARAAGERMLAALGVRDAAPDAQFAVLVPPGRRLTRVDFDWRADRFEGLGRAADVDGIASWGMSRNLLEAAVDAPSDARVQRLADGVRRTGRSRMRRVHELVEATPGHVGAQRLLLLGCLDADAAESDPERHLELIFHDQGPERQVRLVKGIRVDLFLRRLRTVLEYDGAADHTSQAAKARQALRDARLKALGYRVIHVTAADLRDPAALRHRVLSGA